MGKTFLYCPRKGGNYADFAHSTAVPINDSYAVNRDNAYIVPMWAQQANVPIPINSQAAQLLRQYNVPGQIIPVPNVSHADREESNSGWFSGVNFNSLAGLITRVVLDYLDARNRQNESWWQTLARVPTQGLRSYAKNDGIGNPVSKGTFFKMATPVIGTIANAFLPGWGSLLTSGLRTIGNHFLGSGRRRRGGKRRSGKRYKIIYNNKTRNLLRGNLVKDVKQASEDSLKEKVHDSKWRKLITSAFASAIKTVAPAIGSGRLLLGRKLNLKKIKKMGGSASDKQHMAWVRSFIGKKRGKGLKGGKRLKARNSVSTPKGITYYGAGKGGRRRRRRSHGGKLIVYKNHGIHYVKPGRGRGLKKGGKRRGRKRTRRAGRGLVSSGIYKKGAPGNFSGMPNTWGI